MQKLKFTPTVDHQELEKDIKNVCRKSRLVKVFTDKSKDNYESLAENQSNLNPPKGRNIRLD